MSDTEDREARYRRAREVLQGAGWVFDEFVNREAAKIMASAPDDMTTREIAYTRARVATQLKASLMYEVEQYEAHQKIMEKRDGR